MMRAALHWSCAWPTASVSPLGHRELCQCWPGLPVGTMCCYQICSSSPLWILLRLERNSNSCQATRYHGKWGARAREGEGERIWVKLQHPLVNSTKPKHTSKTPTRGWGSEIHPTAIFWWIFCLNRATGQASSSVMLLRKVGSKVDVGVWWHCPRAARTTPSSGSRQVET